MHITKRLSVEGPDTAGGHRLHCGSLCTAYLTRAEADALIAAFNPWRDMDSAPKDGTPILVDDGYRIEVADWGETSVWSDRQSGKMMDWCVGECDGDYNSRATIEPKRWMPLPASSLTRKE